MNSYPKTIEKRTLFGDKFQEKRTKSRTRLWKRSCSKWAYLVGGSVAEMVNSAFRRFVKNMYNINMAMCASSSVKNILRKAKENKSKASIVTSNEAAKTLKEFSLKINSTKILKQQKQRKTQDVLYFLKNTCILLQYMV